MHAALVVYSAKHSQQVPPPQLASRRRTVVGDDDVVADDVGLGDEGGLGGAVAHVGEVGLAVPRVDRAVVARLAAGVPDRVALDERPAAEAYRHSERRLKSRSGERGR